MINETNVKREVKGIIEFSKKFKTKYGIIINSKISEEQTFDGIKIKFVELYDWLLNSNEYIKDSEDI